MGKTFKKILITGGAGYIGSVLTDELLKGGYDVRVIDLLRFGPYSVMQFLPNEHYEIIKGDIRDKEVMAKALEGIDAVVHLAGIVGFPACRRDPELSRSVNVTGTKVLVDLVGGRMPILFASSGSVYGKMIDPICTEQAALNSLTDYGKQKIEGEEIIKSNKEYIIYRFATAFGISPRMRLDLLVHDFTYQAIKQGSLVVYEKNFMRTFIHVRDMARSFVFGLEHYDAMHGQVYNVGDNDMNYSKEAICTMIKDSVDYYLHFAEVGHDADQRNYEVSYEKVNKAGFKTSVGMGEGVAELVKAIHMLDVQHPFYNA